MRMEPARCSMPSFLEFDRMRVKLLSHTELEAVKYVLRVKNVPFDPSQLLDHVVYMFEIEDCSRVTTHQLVRHRVASYDQESQRFSSASREGFVTPPSVQSNESAMRVYDQALKAAYQAFDSMIALGVPKEDARYVLPNAIKTKLVMTVTAKSLMHIVWQRTALQAQWEIKEVVNVMLNLAREATPELWTKIIER
ncbi:MAG: FAD-dependent thymidylate synthase [Thaumarchaeota archaeon]|nr:MAG: FAD-dependent thymidylate synthase [Nitrososphaerota archaeon]